MRDQVPLRVGPDLPVDGVCYAELKDCGVSLCF